MMVRARVSVLDDPPGHPNPLLNEVAWVREGWLVRHIAYLMQPCPEFVKHKDLGAVKENRFRFQARSARKNLFEVPLQELWVE